MGYIHKMQIFHHQEEGDTPPNKYIFIFWPESFLLNMKAIFEHWTVTLLGCLLVDKTCKSNLLSWVCLRIYSAERGGVEKPHPPNLSQNPACFLRNEMERGKATHTLPKGMTVSSCPLFERNTSSHHFALHEEKQGKHQSKAHRERTSLPCSPRAHT